MPVEPARVGVRETLGDLVAGQPRPGADVDLAQRLDGLDVEFRGARATISAVSCARRSGLVYTRAMPSPARASASSADCLRPSSFSGGSACPWNRFSRFQSVSPWRARMSVVTRTTLPRPDGPRPPRQELRRHRLDRRDRPGDGAAARRRRRARVVVTAATGTRRARAATDEVLPSASSATSPSRGRPSARGRGGCGRARRARHAW